MSNVDDWISDNRDLAWGCLRVYLGFALVLKGYMYLGHQADLTTLMVASQVPFASAGLAKCAAVVHVVGGLMLAFGLKTRLGAAIQIPNVAGAILFVHAKDGLFSPGQTLELAMLVLFVLMLYALTGAGRWSTDWYFEEHDGTNVRARA
jgi:uncharacterized membrane protein YphA (DoxX/SURF4 family)